VGVNEQSPALKLEARANRAAGLIRKARDELRTLAGIVQHSELPEPIKWRLYGALKAENEALELEEARNDGLRQAAQISRSKQWVTSGD